MADERSARFCKKCGAEITDGQKFCKKCGNKLIEEETEKTAEEVTPTTDGSETSEKPAPKIIENIAPDEIGKKALGEFGVAEKAGEIFSPAGTALSSAKSTLGNFVGMFKNRQWKKLIIAGILAVVWIALMILAHNGVHVGILSWLTFARGGLGRNVFGWVGGLLGKFTVATAVFSLIGGGYKSLGSGFRSLVDRKNFAGGNLGWLLAGSGTALTIYQFFAGNAIWTDTMSAISGGLLAVMALGSGGGFIFGMARSITAKVSGKTRLPQNEKANGLMSGVAYGFTLGTVVSFIPFGWLPIIIGGVCLIAGMILILVFMGKREVKA